MSREILPARRAGNLPNDFNSAEEQDKPVIIRSHQATSDSADNKSIIHQNMVDIVIAGEKTIIDVYNITSLEAGELMILSKGSSLISEAVPKQGPFHNLAIYFTNEVFAQGSASASGAGSPGLRTIAQSATRRGTPG